MAEYIERECAIKAVKHAWAKGLEPSQYIEIISAADVATVQEWISVKDRLPEEKVNCIVYYRHAYCDNDDYWAIGMCFYDGEKFQMDLLYKVTHWQYLPQPPKNVKK